MNFKIRAATEEDCKEIWRMLTELAIYLKVTDKVTITHEELKRDGFSENPFFECLVAEVPEEHKSEEGYTVVGYALYFYTYSTCSGRTIYLEDLFVMPEFRGKGIGKGLLSKVAELGQKKKCEQLLLCGYAWNTPTQQFYAAKGAEVIDSEGSQYMCFKRQSLVNLANEAPKN
ncbi:thialysine N-epsilon-acetyltransferase-like [Brachionichthys hirsutus]|uniref:thialysine N-epsilon-acetyltransferase-like n=1 Tax=Brachionichthys hirsutus TaxID=412623 RepID=UPI0036048FD6